MIRVDRTAVRAPASLGRRNRKGLSELDRVRAHVAAKRKGAFPFAVYKTEAVKSALRELFHGKCAYCESDYEGTQPVDVEHFRPKNAVEGVADHPGYWWVAMVWENLLPSCIDCNRRRTQATPDPAAGSLVALHDAETSRAWRKVPAGKQAAFPLFRDSFRATAEADDLDRERRLLLDPTRDDPSEHLSFRVDRENLVSLVFPRPAAGPGEFLPDPGLDDGNAVEDEALANGASAMGAVSILVYGLNRLGLVQARSRHLHDLEFLLALLTGVEESLGEIAERREARVLERNAAAARADADMVTRLEDDIAFMDRVGARVGQHRDAIRRQMAERLSPRAPFSAQARTWLEAVLAA